MISACVRSFLLVRHFMHVLMAASIGTDYSKIGFCSIYLLFLHLNCFGTLGCHHIALMWFLSGFTHIIVNNKLVSMSRQFQQSGELGAAVVQQNTSVLLITSAYLDDIAKSSPRGWT